MRRFPLVLLVSFGLLVAACGDDADPSGASGGSSPTEAPGDDAGSGGADPVEVPSDFAIPTVDGAVLVIDSLPGIPDGTYLQLLYPGDRYDELVQFYEAWIGEQSVEWSPTPPDTSDGVLWFSLSLEGEAGYGQSVTIAPPAASDSRVSVSLVAETSD